MQMLEFLREFITIKLILLLVAVSFVIYGYAYLFTFWLSARTRKKISDDQDTYKVFYFLNERAKLKSRINKTNLIIRDGSLNFENVKVVPYLEISSVKLDPLHSKNLQAHVIEIKLTNNEVIYFAVLTGSVLNFLVSSNMIATICLFEKIRKRTPKSKVVSPYNIVDRNFFMKAWNVDRTKFST